MKINDEHIEKLLYRNFIENNIQTITQILSKIEQLLLQLEKHYLSINEFLLQLKNYITTLLQIYTDYPSLNGRSYVLKLQSLVDKHLQITHSHLNLSSLYYIHSKIKELFEQQIAQFPFITHTNSYSQELSHTQQLSSTAQSKNNEQMWTYKWITFKRNDVWFIAPYDDLTTKLFHDFDNIIQISNNYFLATLHDSTITLRDPLRIHEVLPKTILCITFNNTLYGYFYDEIGKKLGSRTNFVERLINTSSVKSKIGTKIRLFGKNHVYLYHTNLC